VRHRVVLIAGGAVVAAGALYRRLRGRRPAEVDRAGELRRKLEESRTIVEEREEFESAETPVDQAEHGPGERQRAAAPDEAGPGLEERRRAVRDQAQAAIDQMQDEN
jgi:hypothetical protein